jgi:hypothetical protein
LAAEGSDFDVEFMFTQMQQFVTDLTQTTRDQLARWDAMWPEVQRAQEQGVKRVDAVIDEAAHWGKQSLAMGRDVAGLAGGVPPRRRQLAAASAGRLTATGIGARGRARFSVAWAPNMDRFGAMTTPSLVRWVLLAALVPSACSKDTPPPAPPAGAPRTALAARYDAAAIRQQVDELSSKLAISPTQKVELLEKLDKLLASPEFAAVLARSGVQAVGVYRAGEGGLVVKIARGSGTVRFAGVPGDRAFEIESTSIGAQVGGSASWGAVLGVGLPALEQVDGTYTGSVASATAIEESAGAVRMVHKRDRHELYFVGIGAGLSANAGEGKLVFALR